MKRAAAHRDRSAAAGERRDGRGRRVELGIRVAAQLAHCILTPRVVRAARRRSDDVKAADADAADGDAATQAHLSERFVPHRRRHRPRRWRLGGRRRLGAGLDARRGARLRLRLGLLLRLYLSGDGVRLRRQWGLAPHVHVAARAESGAEECRGDDSEGRLVGAERELSGGGVSIPARTAHPPELPFFVEADREEGGCVGESVGMVLAEGCVDNEGTVSGAERLGRVRLSDLRRVGRLHAELTKMVVAPHEQAPRLRHHSRVERKRGGVEHTVALGQSVEHEFGGRRCLDQLGVKLLLRDLIRRALVQ